MLGSGSQEEDDREESEPTSGQKGDAAVEEEQQLAGSGAQAAAVDEMEESVAAQPRADAPETGGGTERPPEATGAEETSKSPPEPEEAADVSPEQADDEDPDAGEPQGIKVGAKTLWKGARVAIKKLEDPAAARAKAAEGQPSQLSSRWDDLLLLTTDAIKKPPPPEPSAEEAAEEVETENQPVPAEASVPASDAATADEGSRLTEDAVGEPVYLTDAFLEWERQYLLRISKRMHRLVCAELQRSEEALFMLFVHHDVDLNGVITGSEAGALLDALDSLAPGASEDKATLAGEDGSITFLSLLQWHSQSGSSKATSTTFRVTSAAVGLMGSGTWACDARLDTLNTASLKANVLGYRRMLSQVREYKEQLKLAEVREVAADRDTLLDAMPLYYELLAQEFIDDQELFFELFNEVDDSANLLLEASEVEVLFRLIDPPASEEDMQRYMYEIDVGGGVGFRDLVDWWEQALGVPNSLVAEKGPALLTSLKARAASARLNGRLHDESMAMRNIRAAEEAGDGRLETLRDAYWRTYLDMRDYRKDKELRELEFQCARL